MEVLQQQNHTIANITISYDGNQPHEIKALEDAVYKHCKDSLKQLTVKNGNKNSMSGRHFPHLEQLTFDGHVADSSPTLVASNQQLKYLDLCVDNHDSPTIYDWLYNFRDVDFTNTANLILRIYIGPITNFYNHFEAFPEFIATMPFYINCLNRFEINQSKSDGEAMKIVVDLADVKIFNEWLQDDKLMEIINVFSNKTTITFYYDVNTKNSCTIRGINTTYWILKEKLLGDGFDHDQCQMRKEAQNMHGIYEDKPIKRWKLNLDAKAKCSSKDFDIDFSGIAITLSK